MNLYQFVSDSIKSVLMSIPELAGADLSAVSTEIPKDRTFGDFSTNAAMILTKQLGKSPRQIADIILPYFKKLDFIVDTSVAGPGFINIRLKDSFIFDSVNQKTNINTLRPETIDMDYGAYNVAKSLHIGHLRTSIVGDTLNRIARFLGHKTISYNHIGDWGRPMGLVMAWIEKNSITEITAKELDNFYPLASEYAKNNPEFLDRARIITAQFQDGDSKWTALYNKFMSISLNAMNDIIKRLGMLPFDNTLGEANASKYLAPVEKLLRDKNLLQESDSAQIVVVREDTDTAPMPPFMFYNSRGADTYGATDLAAMYYRKITDNPDRIIYLTDVRQTLHFQQLFRVAKMTELFKPEQLEHQYFGTINGKNGPLKTRDGNAAGLLDIIEIVNDAARERVASSGKELPSETIDMIAMAALKFNDLVHDVKSDYIFDADQVVQFEGRTGPYILYTAVRLNAILKKAQPKPCKITELNTDERNLLLVILDFERCILSAFDRRETDILANYAYDLCQLANTFYHNCPILRDDVDLETRNRRLQIVSMAYQTLSTAIDLMGLKIPPEM
jgi:arginyl-tRNA synthetase